LSKNIQKKFIYFFITWLIGIFIAGNYCQFFQEKLNFFEGVIPAINSYALAAKFQCLAGSVWNYAWIVAPAFIIWIFYCVYYEDMSLDIYVHMKTPWIVFFIQIALFLMCFYGLYEPYPGEAKGVWARFYSETALGVYVVTSFIWLGFYLALLVNMLWIKSLFTK